MSHKRIGRDALHDFDVYPFRRFLTSQAQPLFPAAPHLHLPFAARNRLPPVQSNGEKLTFHHFQFGHIEAGGRQLLIDSADDLGVNSEIMRQPVSQSMLIDPLENRDLLSQFAKAHPLAAYPVLHRTLTHLVDFERSPEHALLATQKASPHTRISRFSINHKASSLPHDYETH